MSYTGTVKEVVDSGSKPYCVLAIDGIEYADTSVTCGTTKQTGWVADRTPNPGDRVTIERIADLNQGARAFGVSLLQ